ncbi:hypothetical protein AB0L64_10420 [Kribbella sp. NPDC051936]|uniref:hypothetical protein n=1 Tax=Kribbella sp. NPDC051936 TaxID=3154946 RepID=UPI00341F130A
MFTATIETSWEHGEGTRTSIEPLIRTTLRDKAAEITRRYSVDRSDAANDEVQLTIATTNCKTSSGRLVEVTAFLQLSVDARSRELQDQRVAADRERRLLHEAEAGLLTSLQEGCLQNAASARLWALIRYPELITVTQGAVVEQIIQDASMATNHKLDKPQDRAAGDLVAWLTGTDESRLTGLKVLYNCLHLIGEHDLRDQLHHLGPIPDVEAEAPPEPRHGPQTAP